MYLFSTLLQDLSMHDYLIVATPMKRYRIKYLKNCSELLKIVKWNLYNVHKLYKRLTQKNIKGRDKYFFLYNKLFIIFYIHLFLLF